MATVRQPSARPTNKLTAAVIATAMTQVARITADAIWPNTFDGPFWIAIDPAVALGVAWFVKDEDNTP